MDLAFPFIQGKKVKAGTICLLWLLTQQAGAASLSRSCDLGIKAPAVVGVAISSLLASLVCYLGLRLYFNCPECQVPSSVLTETI